MQDEYGNILGGKKASIQFAYNLRKQLSGEAVPQETNAATITPVSSQVQVSLKYKYLLYSLLLDLSFMTGALSGRPLAFIKIRVRVAY